MGLPWRGNPNFVANVIVAQDVPVTIMGNYHLSGTGSPAVNAGAIAKSGVNCLRPSTSTTRDGRHAGGFDAGADEIPGGTLP